mmetsp:Transcript_39299/g.63514  ORF Transcript_39299/g.63514 Transcript_39299/m.63514 type:complete len:218 (+) Transcript_39299:408-1061(+)
MTPGRSWPQPRRSRSRGASVSRRSGRRVVAAVVNAAVNVAVTDAMTVAVTAVVTAVVTVAMTVAETVAETEAVEAAFRTTTGISAAAADQGATRTGAANLAGKVVVWRTWNASTVGRRATALATAPSPARRRARAAERAIAGRCSATIVRALVTSPVTALSRWTKRPSRRGWQRRQRRILQQGGAAMTSRSQQVAAKTWETTGFLLSPNLGRWSRGG